MSNHHHLQSLTLALLILAACVGLMAFGATQRVDATPDPAAAAQHATAVPTLIMQRPQDNTCATGSVTFSWRWTGSPLADGQAFEVRLWKAGQRQHTRLVSSETENTQRVDLHLAPVVAQGGTGRYLWSVAVVQLSPYQQLGAELAPRRLYVDRSKPANAPCIVPGSPTNTPDVSTPTRSSLPARRIGTPARPVVEPSSSKTPKKASTPIGPPLVPVTQTPPAVEQVTDTPIAVTKPTP